MNGLAETNRDYIQRMNQLGRDRIPFVFLIDFECTRPKLWRMDEIQDDFLFSFNGVSNHSEIRNSETDNQNILLQKFPADPSIYLEKFNKIISHINKGDSYLVNLTMATPVRLNLSIDEVYQRVYSKYKCKLKDNFVCFSPECFVQIRNGHIHAYPMKGTIDASLPNAENIILDDEKEAAEHATIVDLIRNDLSRIATDVHVSRYRYYEVIHTQDKDLGQISSEIIGTLPNDFRSQIGDLLFLLLPAGSVSGAPKKKTTEIIRAVEGAERGYYTGIAGYFDGDKLDSCVLIRFIENNMHYRSGGGITSNSISTIEFQELIDKVYVPIH